MICENIRTLVTFDFLLFTVLHRQIFFNETIIYLKLTLCDHFRTSQRRFVKQTFALNVFLFFVDFHDSSLVSSVSVVLHCHANEISKTKFYTTRAIRMYIYGASSGERSNTFFSQRIPYKSMEFLYKISRVYEPCR